MRFTQLDPHRMASSTLIFITREKVQTKTTSGSQNGGSRLRMECRSTGKFIHQGLETSWAAWRKEPPSKNVAGSAGQWRSGVGLHVVIAQLQNPRLEQCNVFQKICLLFR